MNRTWSRRTWLAQQTAWLGALSAHRSWCSILGLPERGRRYHWSAASADVTASAARVDPAPLRALALRAIEAARGAGATYADARLTRGVTHAYGIGEPGEIGGVREMIGVGVRALVNGYWGFASGIDWAPDAVVRLAREAVAQAKANATGGLARWVELGEIPVVTGSWETPITIDPFAVPIEEKLASIGYWKECARRAGCPIADDGMFQGFGFFRQEQVVATSGGSLLTQTIYTSGGNIFCTLPSGGAQVQLPGLAPAGHGWENFMTIPERLAPLPDALRRQAEIDRSVRPIEVGRYTLVCDGATMAALLSATLGLATQLDRALGYEANATGTSFLDQPLAMLGTFRVASPHVTVTANRSAPTQVATVKWDDEGVEPQPFTLVQDGVLVDFQTTREQSAWLAPYYHARGWPVRSHGCAAAEDATCITMQMMPNLALEPSASTISMEELVQDVKHGILVEGGVVRCDFQERTGWIKRRENPPPHVGVQMRRITNGVVREKLEGGEIMFATQDLWTHLSAVGGQATLKGRAYSNRVPMNEDDMMYGETPPVKGEPEQVTGFSVCAPAATITNQPVIR